MASLRLSSGTSALPHSARPQLVSMFPSYVQNQSELGDHAHTIYIKFDSHQEIQPSLPWTKVLCNDAEENALRIFPLNDVVSSQMISQPQLMSIIRPEKERFLFRGVSLQLTLHLQLTEYQRFLIQKQQINGSTRVFASL